MRFYAYLPHVNAFLNAASALLLVFGYSFIRLRNKVLHRALMLCAFGTSCLFLTSYLAYHAHAGSVRFQGYGWVRPFYFSVLISHTILAAAVLPLVLVTLRFAAAENFRRHRAIARWTFPVWLYVSVTGVAVYWMLYRL